MKKLTFTLSALCLWLCLVPIASAQWTVEWSSADLSSNDVAGWLAFQQNGDDWSYRYYAIDSTRIVVMTSPESNTILYQHTFTPAERLAGNEIYSLGIDLTGDGIVEFYILSAYGPSTSYRYAMRVFDLVTQTTLFETSATNASYGYPTVWDVDNDGMLECVLTRYDYPALTTYIYEVYDTGIAVGLEPSRQPLPTRSSLGQNYPNPFNPATRIEYELSAASRVEVEILNLLGQRVATLAEGSQTAGKHITSWSGHDDRGLAQASGAYYYRLRVNGEPHEARQMLLVR